MSKLVYVDMDGVIADFDNADVFDKKHSIKSQVHKMYEPGFFLKLKPVNGALTGVRAIMRLGYDVHILSRPVAESAHSYTEKIQWVGLWFPELVNKVNLTQNKELFRGDYLIDDDAEKWKDKWEATGAKFIHFRSRESNFHPALWCDVVEFLREEQKLK